MLEQPVGINGPIRRDREPTSSRELTGINISNFPITQAETRNDGKLLMSSIAEVNNYDPPTANSQLQVRSVRKLPSQLAVRTNMKVQDNVSFQSNYEEFVQRPPASPVTFVQTPTKNSNMNIMNQSNFRKINSRHQSNEPFLQEIGAAMAENLITGDEKYNGSGSDLIKGAEQTNNGGGINQMNKSQLLAVITKSSAFKGETKRSVLKFAEDDEYSYFVKGSIINEGNKHPKDSTTPKHSRTAQPGKSILKVRNKMNTDQQARPTQGRKKTFDVSIDIPKNQPTMMDTSITPNTADNSNSSGKKSGDTRDTEKLLDKDNSILNLLMSAPLINTRGRSSILLPANAGKIAQGQKRNSLGSFRKEQLEKYEKRDYMRRSSDINKLIEFQNSQTNIVKRSAQFIGELLIKLIACIVKLDLIKTTRPSSYSCISNSTHLFFLLFLNLTLIGLLIFLYPIIYNFQEGSSFFNAIFGSFESSTHLAGHCFLILFCFGVFRLAMQIKDFSLDKMERQSFKLVFAELKWNIPTSQAFVMAEKSKLIDQILENIDDNDTDKLINQIMSIIIGQILLSVSNLVILYYILDDSKLLSVLSLDSSPFGGRFIIALIISVLLLLNSLAVRVFFSFFELVAFTFYERTEFYILYFNQMFILAIYQIKILGYFSDIFNISFATYSMKDPAHISFPNYALALSEICFYCLEAIYTFLSTRSKGGSASKIFPNTAPKVQNLDEDTEKQFKQANQPSAVELAQNNILNGGAAIEDIPATQTGLENNIPRLSADFTQNQRLGIKRKTFQDDEGKFAANKGDDSDSQGGIAKTSFRHMRKCIFIFSFNFLILNGALISPCTFILGLAVNAILTFHFSFEQKLVRRHVSYLDFNQFNSQTSVFGLASLLLSAVFNCVVGFYLKNTLSPSSYLFQAEFYYIYEQGTVSQIISIISLPYLLYPAIIFLSALLLQSSYQYKKTYTVLNETYSNLRKSSFKPLSASIPEAKNQ